MSPALASPARPGAARPPLRQRAASFALAAAVTFLMFLALWSLNGTMPERPQFKGSRTVITFVPEAKAPDATPKPSPTQAESAAEPASTPPPPKPIPMPTPPVAAPAPMPFYIHLTHDEIVSADISKIRHPELGGRGPVQISSSAGDSKPVGTAPNGEPLYKAEWYREPTNAELGFYLPPHMPDDGHGVVACRTVAAHHVDDCVEVASSPPGSHLAGAVRQAAWQFLVRAPRLGGKELVGAWVLIDIHYARKARDDDGAPPDAPGAGD